MKVDQQKEESLYRLLIQIAVPITLQSLIYSSLTIIDELMVGQLGESYISAVAISNKVFNIYSYIIMALTGGASIFITQFWGKKDKENIIRTLKLPFLVGGMIAILFSIAIFGMSSQTIHLFSQDEFIIEKAAYLQKIYFLSAIPLLLTNIYSTLLRSTYDVKLPMYTGILSIVTNTILNYFFIFGKCGVPCLGVDGAAIATLSARCLEAIVLVVVFHLRKNKFSFRISDVMRSKLERGFLKRCVNTMWPLLAVNLVFVLADSIYSSVYGYMGTEEMAAMSIMFPIQGFSIGLFNGMSSATAIILGNKLGAKQFNLASKYARQILCVTTCGTAVISSILVAISNLYLQFYNVSESVTKMGKNLIIVAAIFLTIRVLNMVIGQGIIQSGGDTRYILFLDIVGMWCIGIPIAYISAFVFSQPIYVVYGFISLEEGVRLLLGIHKVKTKKWMNNLVEDI